MRSTADNTLVEHAVSSPVDLQERSGISYGQTLPRWASQPWFSYLMLFLLQLKIVWDIWKYRDLTSGDTSSYFIMSNLWFKDFAVNIVWSPLYTAFYGQLLHLSTNAYIVTILHRLIIVFVLAMLVLALMRRLLPPSIAWMIAAWWVILPINFDALYEVHLFAVIPILAAFLLILSSSRPWARGGALAILCASAVLVRNELIVAIGILAIICLLWEIRLKRMIQAEGGSPPGLKTYLISYGTPLLLSGLIVLFFYSRSVIQFPDLPAASAPKHTLNMCQVYAFGYQQRHPEWTKSPWTECYDLMKTEFGKPLISLPEMIKQNPRAVWTHFLWNIDLAPNGLQVLLFNSTSGTVNPDYAPVHLRSPIALLLSIITVSIIAIGLVLLYRERRNWWTTWLQSRAIGWLAMLAVAAVAVVIIPTQRPRASYLFTLGIFIMALTGMCIFAIVRRWHGFERLSKWMPLVMIVLILIIPDYYTTGDRMQPRRLHDLYERLAPFEPLIANRRTVFLVSQYAGELPNYIVHDDAKLLSHTLDYSILNTRSANASITEFLDRQGVNLFYIDNNLWSTLAKNPLDRPLLNSPESIGWQRVALQATGDRWMLLQKKPNIYEDTAALRQQNANPDIGPASSVQFLYNKNALPDDGLFVGNGWYTLETFAGNTFRWANNDVEIVVTLPSGTHQQVYIELEPGPGMQSLPMSLQVLDKDGKIVATTIVEKRTEITLDLSIVKKQSTIFRLHVDGGGKATPNDLRTLNFRVFKFGWR